MGASRSEGGARGRGGDRYTFECSRGWELVNVTVSRVARMIFIVQVGVLVNVEAEDSVCKCPAGHARSSRSKRAEEQTNLDISKLRESSGAKGGSKG